MQDATLLNHFAPLVCGAHEVVAFAFFGTCGEVLATRDYPAGDFASIEVPLRQVVADALACDARQVVMAHNHPSGDPEPSREDLVATRRIASALESLGIRLVDHLVLADDRFTSFRDRGLL